MSEDQSCICYRPDCVVCMSKPKTHLASAHKNMSEEETCKCYSFDCDVCMGRHAREIKIHNEAGRVVDLIHPNGERATQEELERLVRGERIDIKRAHPCGLCGKHHPESEGCTTEVTSAQKGDEPLPHDPLARKGIPIATGFIDYFPDAIAEVARLSKIGNDQHNAGKPLHWDRSKSGDESDALMRHFLQRGTIDSDGVRHSAKVAWRALAMLQKEVEKSREQ